MVPDEEFYDNTSCFVNGLKLSTISRGLRLPYRVKLEALMSENMITNNEAPIRYISSQNARTLHTPRHGNDE